jgi:hypothetical protein
MLPDLIKSLEQPLPLAAGCVLLLSLLAFFWVRKAQVPKLERVAFSAGIFSLIVVLFSTYYSIKQLEFEREYSRLHATFSVHVVIEGTIVGTKKTTLTFQTSSGQVNVGCGEQRPVQVIWTPPEGASDISASAQWRNTDNIKSMNAPNVVLGNTVTASGVIYGLERNVFLNCPGGGHAELVLFGTYDMSEKEPHEQQTLKTLDDKVNRLQPLVISMPEGPNITPQTGEINILGDDNQREDIQIAFRGVGDTATMQVRESKGNIPYTLTFEQGRLTLTVKTDER